MYQAAKDRHKATLSRNRGASAPAPHNVQPLSQKHYHPHCSLWFMDGWVSLSQPGRNNNVCPIFEAHFLPMKRNTRASRFEFTSPYTMNVMPNAPKVRVVAEGRDSFSLADISKRRKVPMSERMSLARKIFPRPHRVPKKLKIDTLPVFEIPVRRSYSILSTISDHSNFHGSACALYTRARTSANANSLEACASSREDASAIGTQERHPTD